MARFSSVAPLGPFVRHAATIVPVCTTAYSRSQSGRRLNQQHLQWRGIASPSPTLAMLLSLAVAASTRVAALWPLSLPLPVLQLVSPSFLMLLLPLLLLLLLLSLSLLLLSQVPTPRSLRRLCRRRGSVWHGFAPCTGGDAAAKPLFSSFGPRVATASLGQVRADCKGSHRGLPGGGVERSPPRFCLGREVAAQWLSHTSLSTILLCVLARVDPWGRGRVRQNRERSDVQGPGFCSHTSGSIRTI